MAKPLGGLRVARSFLTPAGVAVVEAELDFNLPVGVGAEILAIRGSLQRIENTGAVAARDHAPSVQTLHMETDVLEDVPIAAGEDVVNMDTEQLWEQRVTYRVEEDTTNGSSMSSIEVTPEDTFYPPTPVIISRNMMHRAETTDADEEADWSLFIYYRYVELNQGDMANLFARRR